MNAPWKSGVAGTRDPINAYVCDDLTLDVIRGVCEEMGWSQDKAYKGGLRNAIQSLSVSASPQILLVDLSESGDPISDINSLAEVCEPGTIVIAVGQVNDVRLYRDLLMSGLQDYLLKPLSPDALRDAFANAQTILNAPKIEENSADRPHVSTAVIGTRGGCGASTVAASLAWTFSQTQGHPTGFLDLDVHFGTGALAMDLEPGRGLTDAIDNPSRIDGLFIERAMIKANDKLSILSAEAPMSSPVLTDGSAFYQLQEEFRAAFENTVIDMPRSMLIAYPHLMQDVNMAVVTTELTLAAARDTIRVLAWLKQNAPHCKTIIVANNVQAAALEISRKDFESTIERKIDLLLPSDPKATAQAAKVGQPIVQAVRGSKLSTGIITLADMIAGSAAEVAEAAPQADKTKKSVMSGFKSLLKKK
ncbi:pilus assembly protein CpaE [Sphingorhabdus sp. IMCC26285]|uniref:Pilus assembly protein CpaE n=1 Tax=Sphingorhabdus profundilacus TaxID=2509718 RepID=A0A6I4LV35_9SPHN|nr:pilus assembly protein CpaE [Sphingorhabdus profundilacus]MVZ97367.1 pilus assembly protein CpaE [Sphingorhabdus profundilacus]